MYIKLKNNVRYKIRPISALLEMWVRTIITVVCIFVLQDNVSDFRYVRIIGYVFIVWTLKPLYMQIEGLIREAIIQYKVSKYNDALAVTDEQEKKE